MYLPRRIARICLRTLLLCSIAAIALLASCRAKKDELVNVAVAANFTEASTEIARLFEETHNDKVALSFGSTGQLFTQIAQDAPFEVFLAADQETPMKVVAEGLGAQDTLFTYAIGRLALFSTTLDVSNGEEVLREGKFEKLAMANPDTAPYGAAAVETLKSLGFYERLSGKMVQGTNITQAFQFVESSNAEVGFVAFSQVLEKDQKSTRLVPSKLYSPIRQDAVLLRKGADNEAARLFIAFLKGPEAVRVIEKYGYGISP